MTMPVPSWVETNLSPELETDEEIVGAEELKSSSLGRKLAVVATNHRRLVVEDGVFRTKVYPFSLDMPSTTVEEQVPAVEEEPATVEDTTPASEDPAEVTEETQPPEEGGADGIATEQVVEERAPEPSTGGPDGQVETELSVIRGIGPARTASLQAAGVETFEELRAADPDTLAGELGMTASTVRGWQGQADLTAINGVGVTRSSQLVDAGITTIEELVDADPAAVAEALDVGSDTVEGWQAQADLTGISGIGPTRARNLRRSGIATIRQLATAEPSLVAEAVDVDAGTVEGWQEQAIESAIELTDLTEVDGIGPARARRLLQHGVTSQARLAHADTETIAEALDVSTDQVESWQAGSNGAGS